MSFMIKIGRRFELEVNPVSIYIRIGAVGAEVFERFWNRLGMPDGTWPKGTY